MALDNTLKNKLVTLGGLDVFRQQISNQTASLGTRVTDLETSLADGGSVDSAIKANTNAIALLNKTDGTTGSVKKTVDDAIAAQATVDASAYAAKSYEARVATNENAIATLNGDGEGSVKKAVADLEKKIMLGEATGTIAKAYDTVKEIADWIGSNTEEGGALKLASTVSTNSSKISALQTLVGAKKSGDTEASGLCKDIADLQAALGIADASGTSISSRVGVLEAAIADTGSVGSAIKANAAAISTLEASLDDTGSVGSKIKANTDAISTLKTATATKSNDSNTEQINVTVTTTGGSVSAVAASVVTASDAEIISLFS